MRTPTLFWQLYSFPINQKIWWIIDSICCMSRKENRAGKQHSTSRGVIIMYQLWKSHFELFFASYTFFTFPNKFASTVISIAFMALPPLLPSISGFQLNFLLTVTPTLTRKREKSPEISREKPKREKRKYFTCWKWKCRHSCGSLRRGVNSIFNNTRMREISDEIPSRHLNRNQQHPLEFLYLSSQIATINVWMHENQLTSKWSSSESLLTTSR